MASNKLTACPGSPRVMGHATGADHAERHLPLSTMRFQGTSACALLVVHGESRSAQLKVTMADHISDRRECTLPREIYQGGRAFRERFSIVAASPGSRS